VECLHPTPTPVTPYIHLPLQKLKYPEFPPIVASTLPSGMQCNQSSNIFFHHHVPSSLEFNSIQFNSIQFNSIQFNSIQFKPIQSNLCPQTFFLTWIDRNICTFSSTSSKRNIQLPWPCVALTCFIRGTNLTPSPSPRNGAAARTWFDVLSTSSASPPLPSKKHLERSK